MAHCFTSIIRQESALGLYKGLSSPLLTASSLNSILFGVYGYSLHLLGAQHGSITSSMLTVFTAGCAGGLVSSVLSSPMELIKTRLQIHGKGSQVTSEKMGVLSCCRHIYETEGLKGMSRGLVATLWRDVPATGAFFVVYECCLRFLSGATPSGVAIVFAGGTAGTITWALTYPMDVIKSRIQADGTNGISRYRGVTDCIIKSIQEDGFRVLARGLGTCLLIAFPAEAVLLLTYEICLKQMGKSSHIKFSNLSF